MNSDQVTVLDTEVMPDNTVDANATVIEIVIGQHDQDGILPHLTLNQNCVTPEKLQGIHSVVGESNNGVIVVSGISDTVREGVLGQPYAITKYLVGSMRTYINELGFFFFLRIAVEVSISYRHNVSIQNSFFSIGCVVHHYRLLLGARGVTKNQVSKHIPQSISKRSYQTY